MFNISETALNTMFPVFIVMVSIFGLCAFTFLKTDTSKFLRFFLVPLYFSASIFIPVTFYGLLGYSLPSALPSSFDYLHHKTLVKNGKKESIELWIVEHPNKRTRLYLIPYDKKIQNQLDSAKQEAEKGNTVKFGVKKKRSTASNDTDEYPYSVEIKTPVDLLPKKSI
jgi:hypothetical protein